MAKESDLQSKIIGFLKSKGCIVAKMQAGPGVPKGMSDIFWCCQGTYGFIEVKRTKSSPRQVGQEAFLKKMNEWSRGDLVWGGKNSNWEQVKEELTEWLK